MKLVIKKRKRKDGFACCVIKGNITVNKDFYYEILNHVGVRLYVSLM